MAGIQIAEILAILSWGQVDLDEGSAESFRALLRGDILKTAVLMRTWYDDNMLIYHESLRFQLLRHTRYDAVSWSLDASRGYPLETQAGNSKHPTQMQMSFIPLKDGTTICHHHVWWSEGTVVYWINFSSPNADKYPQPCFNDGRTSVKAVSRRPDVVSRYKHLLLTEEMRKEPLQCHWKFTKCARHWPLFDLFLSVLEIREKKGSLA